MKRILVFFLVFMLIPASALGYTATVPEQDTGLHPQGWVAGEPIKFKPGSQVELNERGEVISGVLKYGEYMHSLGRGRTTGTFVPVPTNFISFSGHNSITTFDEHGLVISGTLAGNAYIYLIPDVEPIVLFKGGTTILFDKNGNVKIGTINDDTFLRPSGWARFLSINAGFIKLKSATEVVFGPNAQVLKGTIANDLTVNGVTYPAGTTLQFSESTFPQKI